jgi:Iron-containing redox enzyme
MAAERQARAPWFQARQSSILPVPTRVGLRQMYYYLVNVEEYPEVLPLAYDLVAGRLDAAAGSAGDLLAPTTTSSTTTDSLNKVLRHLAESGARFSRPWRQAAEDLKRRQVLHHFIQYLPMALVDGCWLQCGLRVALAHTEVGAALTGLYQHQLRAFVADPGRHFVADYRAVYARLGAPLEEISSQSFIERVDFHDTSLALPIFLLAIAQFTRRFCAELLGLNLAWQFLGLSAFGPDLIRDTCAAYTLPPLGDDPGHPDHLEKGRRIAREAAVQFLRSAGEPTPADAWERLLLGIRVGVGAWTEWFDHTCETMPTSPSDPRQEMIDMLWRKAPHACGYHADRRLGGKKIDEHLAPDTFDGPALLAELARSPWVNPGSPDRSALLKRLIGFGGPMLAVFSPVEVQIIESWIDSLPPRAAQPQAPTASATSAVDPLPAQPTVRKEEYVAGPIWTPADLRRRSESLYRGCTVRELYHYLINVELHSDVLPMAELFARDRLERSMAMLWQGDRPIPSRRYDPAALERWVYQKHRQQVESYRPPGKRPDAPKAAFVEATVQLAPLVLIDGGWLQGMASPALIHTTVGRMLFHVLVEELGEGKPAEHHANVYRELLVAMGVDAPPVDSWEFARWSRLDDSSFDVPTLWLSISCFPRHFLPEILGLNLAVELAGVGGPYMEARDTLRRFGYPTLFVDVHNAADNVSAGHAAWAMKAIMRYLDDTAEREGPHNLDHTWHRVWAGVRATLPQIGRARLMAHRVWKRFFGEDPTQIPRIFPS